MMNSNAIDYFPLETESDTKFKLIRAKYGVLGVGLVIELYRSIYGTFGYYRPWDTVAEQLFASECRVNVAHCKRVLADCIGSGIFDKDLYEQYNILTSHGIQKRYFEIVKRRKNVKVDKKYLLVSVDSFQENVCKNEKNVCRNRENVNSFQQSKIENIETNKKNIYNARANDIELSDAGKSNACNIPTLEEVIKHFEGSGKSIEQAHKFFNYYSAQNWTIKNVPIQNWLPLVLNWKTYDTAINKPIGNYYGKKQKPDENAYMQRKNGGEDKELTDEEKAKLQAEIDEFIKNNPDY